MCSLKHDLFKSRWWYDKSSRLVKLSRSFHLWLTKHSRKQVSASPFHLETIGQRGVLIYGLGYIQSWWICVRKLFHLCKTTMELCKCRPRMSLPRGQKLDAEPATICHLRQEPNGRQIFKLAGKLTSKYYVNDEISEKNISPKIKGRYL